MPRRTVTAQRLRAFCEPHCHVAALNARLSALMEIHDHWEFDEMTEAEFDDWLHARIKETRRQLGSKACR